MLVNHPRAHRLDRPVTHGGRRPAVADAAGAMSELNFQVVHVYGLTETYGPITVAPAGGVAELGG